MVLGIIISALKVSLALKVSAFKVSALKVSALQVSTLKVSLKGMANFV